MAGSKHRRDYADLPSTSQSLEVEIRELRQRLEEAEGTLHAIRTGQVGRVHDRSRAWRALYTRSKRKAALIDCSWSPMRERRLVLGTEWAAALHQRIARRDARRIAIVDAGRSTRDASSRRKTVRRSRRCSSRRPPSNVHRDITMVRLDGTTVPVHISMSALALSDMPGCVRHRHRSHRAATSRGDVRARRRC